MAEPRLCRNLTDGTTAFTIPIPSAGSSYFKRSVCCAGEFRGKLGLRHLRLVNQAATTITLAAPAVPYGTDGSVTVTVSSAAGTPAGNVSLSVDGGAATTQGLINGSTTFTIYQSERRKPYLECDVCCTGELFGASSASGTLGVGVGATTMTLSAPAVTYGANGIVTVTVSSAAGTPTGNVSLSVDGGAATTQALVGGSTTFTIPSPSAGSSYLKRSVCCAGRLRSKFGLRHPDCKSRQRRRRRSAAPAVTYGSNGIVTVTVSSATGTPTGNVSLSVDGGAATTQGAGWRVHRPSRLPARA